MNRSRETEENRGNRRITVSLGADVSEGYVLRYELHPAEHFTFAATTLGLKTPQQLGERLAAQVIATLDEKKEQPDRIACDLYPKFPTTYAAEVFLCQVGTKKFLRFYKPFIGGRPPVNGL